MVSVFRREYAVRSAAFILGSAVVLTLSFIGILGTISGELANMQSRLPIYILVMATVFVSAIYGLITYDADSVTAMLGAIGISIFGFIITALSGEGVIYSIRFPGRVFGSQLLFYFLAAGLIATGLGYWLLSFWRDLANRSAEDTDT